MFARAAHLLGDNRLMARVLRSTSWIVMGYGASQGIRLASNLILTRLLFPEAFGLMALVSVITVGLMLFSDVGIAPSIAQSRRGDDPAFLNTAWTIQVARGVMLWGMACLLAVPMAAFYDSPDLARYLPIAALTLVIGGFNPTRIETAHRHLLMGRVTALDLASQVIGIAAMIVLALIWQSVAALVVGGLVGAAAKLVLMHLGLPGLRNRFQLERAAAAELIGFGKWIFLSTVCWFFASQGDKAILGKFLSLDALGIYNIGYFLASFPLLLGLNVSGRVMIPVYRENASPARIRRLRYGLSAGVIALLLLMAVLGPWLVGVLYDARYVHAGAIIVVLSVALIPMVIGMSYDQAALAAGDSRRFFFYAAGRAGMQTLLMLIGAAQFGIPGAVVGMGVALVLAHGVLIWLARVHEVWDARHDAIWAGVGAGAGAGAIWLHREAIAAMAQATV